MPAKRPSTPRNGLGIAPLKRPRSLMASAHETIRAGIRDGRFEPEVLYSESELAVALGISRTPVREAMNELSREGLVEVLPQHGFRLRTLSPAECEEVFALREAVETLAAERLAASAGEAEVADLRRCLERQHELRDDLSGFLEADEAMHLLIPELAGLGRTRSVLLSIRGSIWLIGNLAMSRAERAGQVLAEHEAIVDAIAANDPAAAGRAVQAHLQTTHAASEVELIGGRERRAIEIVDYDSAWPLRFEAERERIAAALGEAALRIEHVGSTAVPGLAAKPIVDIQVSVADPADEACLSPLEAAGYVLRVREPGHRMLRTPDLGVHLHVCAAGSEWEQRLLRFRNRLRADAGDRRLYEETKRRLAAREWADMNEYATAKDEVVAAIMSRA